MPSGITNYDSLLGSAGIPLLGPGLQLTFGDLLGIIPVNANVFHVASGHANGGDAPGHGKVRKPFLTLEYATGQCVADQGDIVIAHPGHTETISAAAGWTIDVAGVTYISCGIGTLRAEIAVGTADTADVNLTADRIRIINFHFTGNFDSITALLDIDGADDLVLAGCEFEDVTGQVDIMIDAKDCDDLHIVGLVYRGAAAAGSTHGIRLENCDRFVLDGARIDGNFSTGFIGLVTTASAEIEIRNVHHFRTRNAADIFIVDTITASTGHIGPCVFMSLQDDEANVTEAITGATFRVYDFGVHVVNADNQKSLAINWTASADL